MTLKRNDNSIRQYRPNIGELIKMSLWEDYASLNLNPWIWFRVIGIDAETCTVRHAPLPADPTKDSEQLTIPIYKIAVPLGWEPRYTIYCKPDETEKVISWFARGIVVRANHNLGSNAGSAFQPMDNANVPHWSYPNATDTISAEKCPELFRVVSVEHEEIGSFGPNPQCSFCSGSGRDSIARIAKVRKTTLKVVRDCIASGELSLKEYDAKTGTFNCFCGYYLRDMGRTKRGQVIKAMQQDGWSVQYVKFGGGFWERTRETVIHDLYEDIDGRPRMKCDSCEMLSINHVACHEHGCPNMRARWDAESQSWIKQRKCFDCGYECDADDPCCSAPCDDEDEGEEN